MVIMSVDGNEGTSFGHGLSVIILTTNPDSDRNMGAYLCLVETPTFLVFHIWGLAHTYDVLPEGDDAKTSLRLDNDRQVNVILPKTAGVILLFYSFYGETSIHDAH